MLQLSVFPCTMSACTIVSCHACLVVDGSMRAYSVYLVHAFSCRVVVHSTIAVVFYSGFRKHENAMPCSVLPLLFLQV